MNPPLPRSRRLSPRSLLISVILVGVFSTHLGSGQPSDLPLVPTIQVEHRFVPDQFEFSGRITAVSHITLKARVSGYVTKIHFREGQPIQQGDILFELDARPFAARHAAAEAELLRAQAAAELAKAEAERGTVLRASGAISEEQAEARRTAQLSANAAVRAAQAKLQEAALDLEFTTVRSPVTGRAGRAFVIPGHLVRGGDAAGTDLTEIVTIDPIRVLFEVDEPAYRRLHAATQTGQPIAVEVRVADGPAVPATIDYLGNLVSSATGTAEVRALLPNPDRTLVPGFFARVTVQVGSHEGRLLVPEVAVGADQGGRYLLVVAPDGTVGYRRVLLGDRVGAERVILDGLSAGEVVVVNGLQRVRPGMKVATTSSATTAVSAH